MATADTDPQKLTPPYLPYKTFANTLSGWRVGVPGRIDRSLFRSFSGAMQSWVISTLRYFNLIDESGTPTDRLRALVTADGQDRERILGEVVRNGYGFVFADGFDISTATAGQVADKFRATGLQGDTVRKATALFLALAKDAGMTISPYMKMPRQRRANGVPKRKPAPVPAAAAAPHPTIPTPSPHPTQHGMAAQTPFQVLYELLNLEEMGDEEQAAVWTLLRYLKKRGG